MMEEKRALNIPFNSDKNNLVSWTAFAGCKHRHRDSPQKNGSMFDHNHAALVTLETTRRKPCLVLTDVLKTEMGKTYMERIKQRNSLGSGRCREEPLLCRERTSSQREAKKDKRRVTPKCSRRSFSSSPQRSRVRRVFQNADDEGDEEENEDIEEVIVGENNGMDFAEVVDCGLSLSWEPANDTGSCDEFSPANIKDRCTDPEEEVHCSLKRKRPEGGFHYNGTCSPKRNRESVLRLTGEDGREGGAAPAPICQDESGEDGDLESLDRSIVQFIVGGDDGTEALVPLVNPNVEAGDFVSAHRKSLLLSQDSATQTSSPSEPIVLSSDDEGSGDLPQHRSPVAHTLVTAEDTVVQEPSSREAVVKQQETSDMQVLPVDVEDLPGSEALSPIPKVDYSCMGVPFSTLHCGGYWGKAIGDVMLADHKIIIPLTDASEQVEVTLTFECKELRKYSIWEEQEMELGELQFWGAEEPAPASVLLLCVSDAAAAAVRGDLCKLCVKQDATATAGKASPFILLTLRDPLDGMEGALLRSLLDIECLNSLTHVKSVGVHDADTCWEDIHGPFLSLDDSIELIKRTGLDPHLLSLLALENSDPVLDTDWDSSHSDTDRNGTPLNLLEVEPHAETLVELETTPEDDTETQLAPEEDQMEQELECPSEKREEEPTPVYTLCHRRTKGSYSVSLCKPDSCWIKYKYQGLARRLIQFPPPPLKGGITVTMEDLQCLDSGQFLNDVIIDFYLKYLLHNASAAVAERSHIFSSFFYKQLTRRDNVSEGGTSDSCQRQRRHQRVKTWTRHVDIFKKDFLFVPVNQEAHWYLVVICFPGLNEPRFEAWTGPHGGTEESHNQEEAQGSKCLNDNTEIPPSLNHSDNTETENAQEEAPKDHPPGPVNCTEQTFQKKAVCKRPCILIMDSLTLSLHERVFKLLREYLQSEWEVRRGSSRDFGPDQMKSSYCKVPLQDNSSDCGLYLLQYVESFLKDPVVHFDLPLHLERWFPRQQLRRKREAIRDLVLNLYRQQNLENDT